MKLELKLSSLSTQEIGRAFEAYESSLKAKCDTLCERLAEIGVEVAKVSIKNDESGELRQSISFRKAGDGHYLVVADCGYAVYVEFGTGVVGARSAYPGDMPTGVPRADSSRESWVYFDKKQSRFRITDGEVGQGFMWNASIQMRREIVRIAKEVFAF